MNERPTYAPSGRANLVDLWPYALVLYGLAGLMAVVNALLTRHNAYAVGWVWLAPVGVTTWLTYRAVRDSHCRNAPLAAGLLASVGLVVLLGTYHVDQCLRWGVEWHRLDRLPGFIAFRMETDGWWGLDGRMPLVWPVDARANPKVVPHCWPPATPNFHWLAFAVEFAATVLWPTVVAWRFARRPYSERLHAWFQEEGVVLTPASAADLHEALRTGRLAAWVEDGFEKIHPDDDYVRLKIWLCPRPTDSDGVEPEVYLTLGKAQPVLLSPEEVAAMVDVFPGLRDWAEVPVELRLASLAQTPPPWHPSRATFQPVPPPHAGLCKDPGVKRRGRLLAYGVLLVAPAVAVGYMALTWPVMHLFKALGVVWLTPVYVVAVGSALLGLNFQYNSSNEDLLFRFLVWYYRRTMLGQARHRADALFDVNRPNAIYAEVLPRRVWNDAAAGGDATEAGLVLLDADARCLFFEGDRYRWTVPFAAVRTVEIEVATLVPEFHVVTVTFETAEGVKELPLVALAGVPGADRFERTAALYAVLDEAIGPTLAAERPQTPTPAVAAD